MSYWIENHDKLGRAEESAYIIKFLQQRVHERIERGKTGSYVLNIDATWGEGKTFFMKGLFADLKEAGHPAIMIDAWRDDFSDDPLTAVVAEFDQFLTKFKSTDRSLKTKVKAAGKEFRRSVGKLSLLTAKGIAKRATTYVVGEAAGEIAETAKSIVSGKVEFQNIVDDATGEVIKIAGANIDKFAERKLAQFNEAKLSLDSFQTSLGKAVEVLTAKTYTPPFFILIDELDRCRPTYAIEMLERIKHLFEVENVVFVLGTDTTQLANSIKAVYGSKFDSRHYLARFFDRSYMLAAPERLEMVKYLLSTSTMEEDKRRISIGIDEATYLSAICKQFDLEIRQIEKAIDLLSVICSTWNEPVPIETTLIFPMIVAFLKGNSLNFNEEIDEIFLIKTRSNSFRDLFIDEKNIRELHLLISKYSRHPLSQAHKEKVALHNNAQWNALSFVSQIGYEILEAEYDYTHNKNQRPIFASYANRIKMAGRFIQSDIAP
ncbi:P-loop NTPase fold protein [Agrobacterium tumefaciens]|uniref:KAP family P-loop NTPase fold protein n=1 Tax=Agrobacterium tumefaciens TaxID=358 RepID=UPI0015721C49|nr:P-loop NTPase fold protein [Agrobacterium tumefaciens]NSZ64632.1 hypothetical protein [Agrobacterium tumefaciens]NTA71002.1 hypothetical protein [Agrobacterium tumefaciens]WIE40744.1 P-loop NTPase fold protein [Agrobacterium tumefaciens]